MSLSNQVVLITGAGKGIGKAIAHILAAEGATLMLNARTQSDLESLKTELQSHYPNLQIAHQVGNMAKLHDVQMLIETTQQQFGRIDVLINNAGVCPPFRLFQEISFEDLDLTIDINLKGPLYAIHLALPGMVSQGGGTIININSIAGKVAFPYSAVYCATKFGLKAFSDCLGQEQRLNNIRVVNIFPGAVHTPLWDAIDPHASENPNNMLSPEEVAEAVRYVLQQGPNNWVQDITLTPLKSQI